MMRMVGSLHTGQDMEYEVTAVEKIKLDDGSVEILAIGNNRSGWQLTTASAIHRITANHCEFYISDHLRDRRTYLCPSVDKNGRLLLGAVLAGQSTDPLHHLPSLRDCDLID